MDPSPAWPQFQEIPAETLTQTSNRPSSPSPFSFTPILSLFGVFQAHLSAGTQSPSSASLSWQYLRASQKPNQGFVVSEEEFDEEDTTHNAQRLSQVCCNRVL